jgi:poly(3-hydroxybutyrate) depolymerase
MRTQYKLALLSLAVFLHAVILAQQTAQRYARRETGYLLYLPPDYGKDTTKIWPMLVYLHGAGETGHDLERLKLRGLPSLIAQGKNFPFIVVSPQTDELFRWENDDLYHFVVDMRRKYRVNQNQVWLSGISMGGFAVWSLAIAHPELFAAIVPISSGGDTARAWRLKYMPVWCFHRAADAGVPLSGDQRMMDAVKKYNPGNRLTIYQGIYRGSDHDAWTEAYNNDSLWTWLLAQKKFSFQEIKIPPAQLKPFAGVYVNPGDPSDAIIITVQDGSVKFAEPGFTSNKIELKPCAGNVFFVSPDLLATVEFLTDRTGKISRLYLMDIVDDKRLYYDKRK